MELIVDSKPNFLFYDGNSRMTMKEVFEPFVNNCSSKSQRPPPSIKRKLNLRRRLLKPMNNNASNELRNRIKNLNVEIKNHFDSKKTCSVRRKITPGNTKSLWDAVKLAKDINNPKLPNHMFLLPKLNQL